MFDPTIFDRLDPSVVKIFVPVDIPRLTAETLVVTLTKELDPM